MAMWKKWLYSLLLGLAAALAYLGLMWVLTHHGGCPKGQAFRIIGAWVGCL